MRPRKTTVPGLVFLGAQTKNLGANVLDRRQRGLPDLLAGQRVVVGPHRLRHTLATEMLAAGAALSEISQVLRHSDLATTAIYAKVALGRLRQVARPWPGAAR